MNKILVILTGGTIGSKNQGGTVDVNTSSAYRIVSLYNEEYGDDIDFDVLQPTNKLSENIVYEDWERLCNCLDNVDINLYKGIVICHGSDTLSYTSSLVGMLYNHLPIPIVLIASNYELDNPLSNGLFNFRTAVCVINTVKKGVYVAYGVEKRDVYLATRLVESDPYNDKFSSFDGKVWGEVINNSLVVNNKPTLEEIYSNKTSVVKRPMALKKNVMLIRPYPNMNYENINLNGVSAVVHYMYHSATACTVGRETSLLNFSQRCRQLGVRLYVASFKDRDIKRAYMSSREILSAGAMPMFNISEESAYIKVLICENSDVKTENTNFYFESI